MLADSPEDIWTGNGWRVEVQDEAGLVLFTLELIASLTPGARHHPT